ncbi:hypothetical protein DAEQUDRAFT_270036 [Daedalea quercina L-15889]|uniref:Uncharacterized protein n=1 Tax=Daedalea quercina L-15889 TaxID=1314783 RepID=A0A165QBT0_9APHY|nr:hypothetical protein DAEQUDRAFT_270036 [Daedalea quercina L-15889]
MARTDCREERCCHARLTGEQARAASDAERAARVTVVTDRRMATTIIQGVRETTVKSCGVARARARVRVVAANAIDREPCRNRGPAAARVSPEGPTDLSEFASCSASARRWHPSCLPVVVAVTKSLVYLDAGWHQRSRKTGRFMLLFSSGSTCRPCQWYIHALPLHPPSVRGRHRRGAHSRDTAPHSQTQSTFHFWPLDPHRSYLGERHPEIGRPSRALVCICMPDQTTFAFIICRPRCQRRTLSSPGDRARI